jgi:hypothetical protein
MRFSVTILFVFIGIWISSCGGGNRLDIQGDTEAITMAENMILEMGGKKNWQKLKSLYIRTITIDMRSGEPFAIEEWINLDEPKFMNHRVRDDVHYFQIVDKNDGWTVQNSNVTMMMPASVTGYLNWFDNFFMRNVKLLAIGGQQVEVKVNGENAFDMFINNEFVSGFHLNENKLPVQYIVPSQHKRFDKINIKEWGEFKGFKYPLEITGENIQDHYQTDYWDIGFLDAESSFNISFDPQKIAQNF